MAQGGLDRLSPSQFLFSVLSVVAALLLPAAFGWRLATGVDLSRWWVPLALVGGIAATDFPSGLIHWAADTWGRDDRPIIGRRLLVPFRLHHINPDDFLRRPFADTNGDVAVLAIPPLTGLLAVPLDQPWAATWAVFGFGFCAVY